MLDGTLHASCLDVLTDPERVTGGSSIWARVAGVMTPPSPSISEKSVISSAGRWRSMEILTIRIRSEAGALTAWPGLGECRHHLVDEKLQRLSLGFERHAVVDPQAVLIIAHRFIAPQSLDNGVGRTDDQCFA